MWLQTCQLRQQNLGANFCLCVGFLGLVWQRRGAHYAKMPSALADPLEEGFVTAPLSAGPPPLFDVTSFSKWVTDVFTEEHDDEVLDKLAAMDASDDMAKMRLLLNEEVAARRARLGGDAIHKSYTPPEEGAGSRDVMMIAFAGENDTLVRAKPRARSTPRITPAT